MDASAWISLGSAVVAVLSLIATVVFAVLAARSANRAQAVTVGAAETALRNAISFTRQRVGDLSLHVGAVIDGRRRDQLTAKDKRQLELLDKAFRSAVEDNLNAYEDACAKYLDGKIDRKRFKKSYVSEIQNVCNQTSGAVAEFMYPESPSKFQAIWKVYREWHIHEE